MADSQKAAARCEAEAAAVRRHAATEVEQLAKQIDALKGQLGDATVAAAGLQELLEAQQRVAEAYRAEANRSLTKIAQLEQSQQPLQQTLASYRQEEAHARQALAVQLQQQQSQLQSMLSKSIEMQRTDSLSNDELRAELIAARKREEEQRSAMQQARLIVQ
jgi:hypothetical protein